MPRRTRWMVLGLGVALVCYYLPWYAHPTAAFTTSAHDLAEWTSLHPAVRSSSPQLLTTFYLRVPQLALIAALALTANRMRDARGRWVLRAAALLLGLRFMPPGEFFTTMHNDPNYEQMAYFTAAGIGINAAAWFMSRLPSRGQDAALVLVLVLGTLAAWQGLAEAKTLLENFEIEVTTGLGIIGYTLASSSVVLLVLWSVGPFTRGNRPALAHPQVVIKKGG